MTDCRIPTAATHRGVVIHAGQSASRLSAVKGEIDCLYRLSSSDDLLAWAEDVAHSPESRLFAAAKLRALWDFASEAREVRPSIDLERLDALVAGLDSVKWRDPERYCSLLDNHDRAMPRERPLEE